MRLFKEDPKWTPLKRSEETDANEFRKEYLKERDDSVENVSSGHAKDGTLDAVPGEQRMT